MKFFFIFLLSFVVHGATITSTQAGDWNVGSTWVGGIPPGSGDSAVVNHAVLIPAAVTVTTQVISGSNTLTINGVLNMRGNISTTLVIGPAGHLMNDSGITSFGYTGSSFTVNGNCVLGIPQALISKTIGSVGGSGFGTAQINVNCAEIDDWGISGYLFNPALSGAGQTLILTNSVINRSGVIATAFLHGGAIFNLQNNSVIDPISSGSRGGNLSICEAGSPCGALTTGKRNLINNRIFDRGVAILGDLGVDQSFTVQNNFFRSTVAANPPFSAPSGSFTPIFSGTHFYNNMMVLDRNTGLNTSIPGAMSAFGGTQVRGYILILPRNLIPSCSTNTDGDGIIGAAGLDTTYDGWVVEPTCAEGNTFIPKAGAGAFTWTVKNTIVVPDINGRGVSLLTSNACGSGNTCSTDIMQNNTIPASDVGGTGFANTQGTSLPANITSVANNIGWRATSGTCGLAKIVDPLGANIFSGVDYNWTYNCTNLAPGGTTSAWNYSNTSTYVSPNPPNGNGQTGDPQFKDKTRNFLSYCALHGAVTHDACFDLFKIGTSSYDPSVSVGALLDYVRDGFIPGNSTIATASNAGSWVGAMPPSSVATPKLLFSDLESGPNTGGENNKGAYVCVWGNNLGASRGSSVIKVGNGLVDNYPLWQSPSPTNPDIDKVCFQLGASVASGDIVATVNGINSNPLPFTVRSTGTSPDGIWCLSAAGSDANDGHYTTNGHSGTGCKATFASVRTAGFAAGDITYMLNGYTPTTLEPSSNILILLPFISGGSTSLPFALLGAPGATVTLGTATTDSRIFYFGSTAGSGNGSSYWIVGNANVTCAMHATPCVDAGIAIGGETSAKFVHDLKRIGIKCQAPSGYDIGAGCMGGAEMYNMRDYANELTNIGCGFGSTGGIDGSDVVNQAVQNRCPDTQATYFNFGSGMVEPSTINSSGTTITDVTSNALANFGPGTHICAPDCTNPANEKIIVSQTSASSMTVNSPWASPLVASGFHFILKTPSKFLHAYYPGGTSHDFDIGWNYIHNNSDNIGFSIHAQPNNQSHYELVSTTNNSESGTNAAQVVLPFAFDFPIWQSGDRVDINRDFPGGGMDTSLIGRRYVKVINTTHAYLYADAALTIPVTGSGTCNTAQCGIIIHEGFRAYNMEVHHNRVMYQNGICLNMATLDPGNGPVRIYNNILAHCGQGPNTTTPGGGQNLEAFLTEELGGLGSGYYTYGSGTFYFENNTLYDAARYLSGDNPVGATLYLGSIGMLATDLTMSTNNNIIYNLDSGARYYLTTSSATTVGSKNIIFGGSTAAQPSGAFSGTPASITGSAVSCAGPCSLFTDTNTNNFTLASGSVAAASGGITTFPSKSYDSIGRPQASTYSLGAYEVSNAVLTCTITPSVLGPYTQGVPIGTVTMTANNCGGGTLTWNSSSLPTGISGCNSVTGTTCNLTGTPSVASTFNPTISVSDGGSNSASINPTVIVNSAPIVSHSGIGDSSLIKSIAIIH